MIRVSYVTAPFRWLRKMAAMLRELRTHEERTLTARDVLARELWHNAYVLRKYEATSWSIHDVQAQLDLSRWHQLATEWSVLRKRHLALWNEIADVYDALSKTKGTCVDPPSSDHLEQLAERLAEAEL